MDQQIDQGTPGRSIRGVDALVDAIRAEASDEFPMDREGVNYSFGDIEVENGKGGFIAVRDLADRLKRDSYANKDELLHGLTEALSEMTGSKIVLERIHRDEDLADTQAG